MPHKCIQISEEGFLGSTYMKTGKVLATAAAFISANITQKAQGLEVFFGGGRERSFFSIYSKET